MQSTGNISAKVQAIASEDLHIAIRTVGLACCAVEVADARAVWANLPPVDGQPDAHILVVAGTVSAGLVADLMDIWQQVPHPKAAVAYGACTISGGPYWDSYQVRQGLPDGVAPVVEVPGCPPRPDVLTSAVTRAARLALTAGEQA